MNSFKRMLFGQVFIGKASLRIFKPALPPPPYGKAVRAPRKLGEK